MEPAIPDLSSAPRPEAYARLLDLQSLLLDGSSDRIAAMATTSALLHHAFGHLWTGSVSYTHLTLPTKRIV